MTRLATREDGWPRSAETAELLRRISVIRWFEMGIYPELRAPRVARALDAHAKALEWPTPNAARILSATEGRKHIESHGVPVATSWRRAIAQKLDIVREQLLQSERAKDHPLLDVSGRAVFLRPAMLPIDRRRVAEALNGEQAVPLAPEFRNALVERILWELGGAIAWELGADLTEGQNPFRPLLTFFEEGLILLSIDELGSALLWAPSARRT